MATISRRGFLLVAPAGAGTLGTLWGGCDGRSSATARNTDASAGPDGPGNGDTLPPTCGLVTEANIEGPFFLPASPENRDLRAGVNAGTPLRISGQVFDTGCRPAAGALLDFWQADDAGAYDNIGFTLRGHQFADQDGRYQLETIIPGRYLNGAMYRPSHVHVKAQAAGGALLTTQLYFAGDPFNATDAFILPSLIMSITDGMDGLKLTTFDFVLPP